jgi:hypothetical protein
MRSLDLDAMSGKLERLGREEDDEPSPPTA